MMKDELKREGGGDVLHILALTLPDFDIVRLCRKESRVRNRKSIETGKNRHGHACVDFEPFKHATKCT